MWVLAVKQCNFHHFSMTLNGLTVLQCLESSSAIDGLQQIMLATFCNYVPAFFMLFRVLLCYGTPEQSFSGHCSRQIENSVLSSSVVWPLHGSRSGLSWLILEPVCEAPLQLHQQPTICVIHAWRRWRLSCVKLLATNIMSSNCSWQIGLVYITPYELKS